MNKDSSIGKLFPTPPRYGKRIIDTRARPKICNHDVSSDISCSKQFHLKYCSNKCKKLLEAIKKGELKLLGCQA